MYDTHTPTEWAAYGWLGVGAVGVIKFALAFADADAAYFDPRPVARRELLVVRRELETGRLVPVLEAALTVRHNVCRCYGTRKRVVRNAAKATVEHAKATARDLRTAPKATAVEAAITATALLALLLPATGGAPMTGITATDHFDADGEEFVDGAEYLDRHGDTWRAAFDATEFLHVKRADEEQADRTCNRWCEDITAVARDFGPMTKVTEAA